MWLVASVDAAASSLLSSLQWSCLPSPYAPQRQEDGEHDGANKGAWRSSSASAVAGVVCWRMSVMCRSELHAFVAAVGKYHSGEEVAYVRYMNMDSKKKRTKSHSFVDWPILSTPSPLTSLSLPPPP